MPFLSAYINAIGENEYYEEVLRVITNISGHGLSTFLADSYRWYEIDDLHDLSNASTLFSEDSDKYYSYHARYGGYWRFSGIVDYCYLVNPAFPPQKMIDEMSLDLMELVKSYPSTSKIQNELSSNIFKISPEYIVTGNGASEFIPGLIDLVGDKTVGLLTPSFDEYNTRLIGKNKLFLQQFNSPYEEALNSILEFLPKIEFLVLVNPGNPTGFYFQKHDILKILRKCRDIGVIAIIDESFIDFNEFGFTETLLSDEVLEEYPNLIVIKSISKSF